jgi:hypothetical protein
MPADRQLGHCASCIHFDNDPATLERELPGLTAMGSGHAAVRADDGFCRQHGLYLAATDSCPDFQARPLPDTPAATR